MYYLTFNRKHHRLFTFRTDATVTVADVFTSTAMTTEFRDGRSFAKSGILTGDHFYVAKDTRPAGRADTLVSLVDLLACGSVETGPLSGLAGQEKRSRV